MTITIWILITLLVASGAVIAIMRDWRFSLIAVLVNYIAQGLFIAQQQFVVPDLVIAGRQFSSLVFIKLITGIGVAIILGITALTFSREYGLEDLDEFSLAELRRAARVAQRASSQENRKVGDYIVPIWSTVLVGLASFFLPRVLPLAVEMYPDQVGLARAIDFMWYWQVFIGLISLVLATDILKIGLGLLLCLSGLDLLYTTLANRINILALGTLSLVTLLLALAIAYLSGLLYGRFKTLNLSETERLK
ncbi:MAG TPA: hypothetical protein DEF47_22190 [Herpetosiphon sp.]|uniref:Uncharacterized protein n=1 Tax=Herpetosiphon aurantiacus (strain ATCC 23779 / DSM 785 / 114-95) TaxID=316274 RepID=A9B5P8_HERA2|nr:hypothetical protein [Herpetosiphon sp.]ABX04281.1 conserved hypothetical protein [Herpetosiphon aurantiacus DSM 785]HBW52600.1 hypothetical protein [Herpetosiphon sp.]